MKFTHGQLNLIQAALRVAAEQYSRDRSAALTCEPPNHRIAAQFYKQAAYAREMADWIDNQE